VIILKQIWTFLHQETVTLTNGSVVRPMYWSEKELVAEMWLCGKTWTMIAQTVCIRLRAQWLPSLPSGYSKDNSLQKKKPNYFDIPSFLFMIELDMYIYKHIYMNIYIYICIWIYTHKMPPTNASFDTNKYKHSLHGSHYAPYRDKIHKRSMIN
jgi:hypothetical protein